MIEVKRLPHAEGLPVPGRATAEAAGFDLCAAIDHPHTLYPGHRMVVPTGFAYKLPVGHAGLVCPRSGLAAKYGITVLNAPGVVDQDYRGEVKVILFNEGDLPYAIHRGDRIAQMVVTLFAPYPVEEVDVLDDTQRGEGGFGSTGA